MQAQDTTYVGPTTMACPARCEVPEGVSMTVVPAPRHDWPDVVRCPNEGCGCAFLVVVTDIVLAVSSPQESPTT